MDDESLISSSADSSYEDSDNSEAPEHPHARNHINQQQFHFSKGHEAPNDLIGDKVTSPRTEKIVESTDNLAGEHQQVNMHDESLFTHNLDQTAAPSVHPLMNGVDNKNYLM